MIEPSLRLRATGSAGRWIPSGWRAIGYAVFGAAIVATAFWISAQHSLATTMALLTLPVVGVAVLLYRPAAGHVLLLLLPFSGISIAEGVGLFKWTTVVVIGLWFLAVLLLESISVLRFDVTDVLVALFCASSSVSLILAGPGSDAASFLGAYASVFGVYFVVSRSVTTPKEAKRAVAALCVGLGVAARTYTASGSTIVRLLTRYS